MNRIIKLLTINKNFVFVGQIDDLKENLMNSKDINYKILNEKELKFFPNISWGTLTISSGPGLIQGINVKALISDLDSDRLKINFRTKMRPEHYFLIIMFIFFFSGVFLSNESKWLFLYIFGLWIICHLWFQFIYRLQENYLIDKVTKRLRLKKM